MSFPDRLRLITWNVAGRLKRLTDQIAALSQHDPDLVALQEVRARSIAAFRARLPQLGLCHILNRCW